MDSHQLWLKISDKASILADAANYSTVSAFARGFNDHGYQNHIYPIKQTLTTIALHCGLHKQELNETLVAAAFHDAGMIHSRKLHPLISPYYFQQFFPALNGTPMGNRIEDIIRNHDEGILGKRIEEFQAQHPGTNEYDVYTYLSDEVGPQALALVLADKVQIGRMRVTPSDVVYAAKHLTEDMHTLVSALIDTQINKIRFQDKIVRVPLTFNPRVPEYEQVLVRNVMHSTKLQIEVPEAMHTAHREYGYPHFFFWFEQFVTTYSSRLTLAARAAFALKPGLQQFKVDVTDRSAEGIEMGFNIVINRGEVMPAIPQGSVLLNPDDPESPQVNGAMSSLFDTVRRRIALQGSSACHKHAPDEIVPGMEFWYTTSDARGTKALANLLKPKEQRNS